MSKKSTAVARKNDDQLPAFMRDDVGRGTENLDRDDMEIPRLKLMQGLSPELQEYDQLRPGMFWHTASEHSFGSTFRAVPVFIEKRFMLWNPREAGGGILARADDGVHWSPANTEFTVKLDKKDGGATVKWRTADTVVQSGLANWGSMNPDDSNSPPAATLMYNYLLAFPDNPDLDHAVLTFQRSSVKFGRRFNTKLRTIRAPIFGLIFEFSSFQDTNRSGQDFYNVNVRGDGRVQDEKLYNELRDLNQSLSERGLNIRDVESMQDDAEGDNEDEDEPQGKTDSKGRRRI